jgi:hypothetical protein
LKGKVTAWKNVRVTCAKEKKYVGSPSPDPFDLTQLGVRVFGWGSCQPRQIEPVLARCCYGAQSSDFGFGQANCGQILIATAGQVLSGQWRDQGLQAGEDCARAGNGDLLAGDDVRQSFKVSWPTAQGQSDPAISEMLCKRGFAVRSSESPRFKSSSV